MKSRSRMKSRMRSIHSLAALRRLVSCLVGMVALAGWPSPLAAQQNMTEEEFAASLPPDVYPDSRSRIPLVDREDLDEEGKRTYDDRVSPNSTRRASSCSRPPRSLPTASPPLPCSRNPPGPGSPASEVEFGDTRSS